MNFRNDSQPKIQLWYQTHVRYILFGIQNAMSIFSPLKTYLEPRISSKRIISVYKYHLNQVKQNIQTNLNNFVEKIL